ncbi:hypothetical protein ACFZCK_14115 [Kitasatospora purpeofusca]|uniref:hypothetical protein n=1 Tax=Kitasatospora purpeofusca TaxID=67352 RepID=UPI0036E7390D
MTETYWVPVDIIRVYVVPIKADSPEEAERWAELALIGNRRKYFVRECEPVIGDATTGLKNGAEYFEHFDRATG